MELINIKKYPNIHMIGIGGVSMSGLAELLSHFGFKVTGSDAKENNFTKHLQSLNIPITIGHNEDFIKNADLVVYTAAIPDSDVELKLAKSLNKPLMERGKFLGEITLNYPECICISGTHGKTTTTSLISLCFLKNNLDPTIEVGAYLKNIDGNNRTGNSDYFILEACEYKDSFLSFHPHTEVILNIDNDHLDYFKNIDNIKKSFLKFTNCLDNEGTIIANWDDVNTKEVLTNTPYKLITYGINSDANFVATNIKFDSFGYPTFQVLKNNQEYDTFTLNILGKHNILNALACIAVSDLYNIPNSVIKEVFKEFTGAERRFQKIGEYKSIPVYDDYAHHPTEIAATYASLQSIPHNNAWAIFEPHTYSRTKDHLNDFANVLAKFDNIIIAPIYAARETNTYGVDAKDLVKLIKEKNKNCIYLEDYQQIIDYLKEKVKNGDVIITIGAGTINQVGYKLVGSL